MKYLQYPISKTIDYSSCIAKDCATSDYRAKDCARSASSSSSLKPIRSVHFPNEVLFHDYVRTGELERIGRFIRARRVSLDTIYHSGEPPDSTVPFSITQGGNTACFLLILFSMKVTVLSLDNQSVDFFLFFINACFT